MKLPRLSPLFFSVRLPTLLAIFWRTYLARPKVVPGSRKAPLSLLVVRLDALGDVVMTTPLFRALKAVYPHSRCTVAVQKSYKSLLATNPYVDEILTLPVVRPEWLPQSWRRMLAAAVFYWRHLRKRPFDLAISPRWDTDEHLATFLCVMSHARHRAGYSEQATAAKRTRNRGFDHAYDTCLAPGAVQHEVLRNLAAAHAPGACAAAEVPDASTCEAWPEIRVTTQDRRRADRLLAKVPRMEKLVALGIGAQSPGRRWPLRRYAETLARLERLRLRPVIVCSEAELGEALKLTGMLPRRPVIVSGAPLREVCAVLERCELFLGNDSGCAHLAAAMGCKTIVISRHPRHGDPNHFNSPVRFAPLGREVRVLQPASGRGGCRQACASPEPHCILEVSIDDVVCAAQEMLPEPHIVAPRPPASKLSSLAITGVLPRFPDPLLPAAVEALQPAGGVRLGGETLP